MKKKEKKTHNFVQRLPIGLNARIFTYAYPVILHLFYNGCMVITGKTFHILFAKELIFFFILKNTKIF